MCFCIWSVCKCTGLCVYVQIWQDTMTQRDGNQEDRTQEAPSHGGFSRSVPSSQIFWFFLFSSCGIRQDEKRVDSEERFLNWAFRSYYGSSYSYSSFIFSKWKTRQTPERQLLSFSFQLSYLSNHFHFPRFPPKTQRLYCKYYSFVGIIYFLSHSKCG